MFAATQVAAVNAATCLAVLASCRDPSGPQQTDQQLQKAEAYSRQYSERSGDSILSRAPCCCCCCCHRNAAEFDPTEVFENATATSFPSSYQTLVLRPTLQAVKTALQDFGSSRSKNIQVSIGLGAEQGRSHTVYAAKWEVLAKEVQATLKNLVKKVYVGPHFDPNKLCG